MKETVWGTAHQQTCRKGGMGGESEGEEEEGREGGRRRERRVMYGMDQEWGGEEV